MIFDEDYIVIEEDTDLDSEIDDLSTDEPSTDDIENLDTDESTETSTDAESTEETPEPQDSGESDEVEPQEDDEETISIDTMSDNDIDSFADDLEQDEPEKDQNDYFDDKNPYQVNTNDNNTKPTEIGIDVTMSNFGTDNSPVQNQYDPKEVDRLNTLIASENSAIGEYFQASKETNVDVLRRLYSDIGEEERFHVEQLLFAKSQVTGERYIPRDPDVKREYEELLSMGMDEETAMATAVDKVGLINKNFQISPEESIKTMEMAVEQAKSVTESMYQEYLMFSLLDSTNTFSFRERDKAVETFIEAYLNNCDEDMDSFFSEAVTNPSEAQPKTVTTQQKNSGGILKGIGRFIGTIIKGIGKLIGVIATFIKRRVNHLKTKLAWLKNHKITEIFKSGFHLYFYNDNGSKVGFAYDEAAQYLIRLINCCKMIASTSGCHYDFSMERMKFKQVNLDTYKPATLEEAIKNIKSAQLIKTKVIIDEHNSELFLKEAFGVDPSGNTTNVKSDGAFNKLSLISEDFKNAATALEKLTNELQSTEMTNRPNSLYQSNRAKYDMLVGYLKDVAKGFQVFLKCIGSDISTLGEIDTQFTRAAESDSTASAQAAAGSVETQGNNANNNGAENAANMDPNEISSRIKTAADEVSSGVRSMVEIVKNLDETNTDTIISNLENLKNQIGKGSTTTESFVESVYQEGKFWDTLTTKIQKGNSVKETLSNISKHFKGMNSDEVAKIYEQQKALDLRQIAVDSINKKVDVKQEVNAKLVSMIDDIIAGLKNVKNGGGIGGGDTSSDADITGNFEQLKNDFNAAVSKINNITDETKKANLDAEANNINQTITAFTNLIGNDSADPNTVADKFVELTTAITGFISKINTVVSESEIMTIGDDIIVVEDTVTDAENAALLNDLKRKKREAKAEYNSEKINEMVKSFAMLCDVMRTKMKLLLTRLDEEHKKKIVTAIKTFGTNIKKFAGTAVENVKGKVNEAKKSIADNKQFKAITLPIKTVFNDMMDKLFKSDLGKDDTAFVQVARNFKNNFSQLEQQASAEQQSEPEQTPEQTNESYVQEAILDSVKNAASKVGNAVKSGAEKVSAGADVRFKAKVDKIWSDMNSNIKKDDTAENIFKTVKQNCMNLCDEYIRNPKKARAEFAGKEVVEVVTDEALDTLLSQLEEMLNQDKAALNNAYIKLLNRYSNLNDVLKDHPDQKENVEQLIRHTESYYRSSRDFEKEKAANNLALMAKASLDMGTTHYCMNIVADEILKAIDGSTTTTTTEEYIDIDIMGDLIEEMDNDSNTTNMKSNNDNMNDKVLENIKYVVNNLKSENVDENTKQTVFNIIKQGITKLKEIIAKAGKGIVSGVNAAASAVSSGVKGIINNIKNAKNDKQAFKESLNALKQYTDNYNRIITTINTKGDNVTRDERINTSALIKMHSDVFNIIRSYDIKNSTMSNYDDTIINGNNLQTDDNGNQYMDLTNTESYKLHSESDVVQEALFGGKNKQPDVSTSGPNARFMVNLDFKSMNNIDDVMNGWKKLYNALTTQVSKYKNGIEQKQKKLEAEEQSRNEIAQADQQRQQSQGDMLTNVSGKDQSAFIKTEQKKFRSFIEKIKSESKTPEQTIERLERLKKSAMAQLESWKTGKRVTLEYAEPFVEYFNDAIVAAYEQIVKDIDQEINRYKAENGIGVRSESQEIEQLELKIRQIGDKCMKLIKKPFDYTPGTLNQYCQRLNKKSINDLVVKLNNNLKEINSIKTKDFKGDDAQKIEMLKRKLKLVRLRETILDDIISEIYSELK